MAWVKMVEENEATGIVKEEYKHYYSMTKNKGRVAEIMKVFSLRPDLLRARVEFGKVMTFGGSGLGRYREELIATSISAQLSCKFWGIEHAEFLRRDGQADIETVVAVSTDWRKARLTSADYAMLDFSEKLTGTPSAVTEKDLAALRQQGFSDREILSVTLAAAYRNFITRVADGLGVELTRDGGYASEILRAFGVSEADVKTTLYGDRQTAREARTAGSRAEALSGVPGSALLEGVCGIDTTVTDKPLFDETFLEFTRLTGPRPMRHLVLAFGPRPNAVKATLEFGRLVGMGGSGLGRRLEAIIGLVVASRAWMPYVGVHHAQALLDAGGGPDEVEKLVQDPSGAFLDGPEREVARYCEKLTREPGTMARSDLESLRRAGFSDRDLVTIAAGASFENFLGRVATGVLVRLEEDLTPKALRVFQAEEGSSQGATLAAK